MSGYNLMLTLNYPHTSTLKTCNIILQWYTYHESSMHLERMFVTNFKEFCLLFLTERKIYITMKFHI